MLALPGSGVMPGSFMTGEQVWLVIGLGLVVLGGLAMLRPSRRV